MIRDSYIRTWAPFVLVLIFAFFLADANILESFGNRLDMLQKNVRLLLFLVSGDAFQMVGALICATVFFAAWKANRVHKYWFSDLYWQLAGVFFCIFLRGLINIIGTFYLYLWLMGIIQMFKGIFLLYFSNTLWAARKMLYHPEMPEEAMRKAAKFDELISYFKREENGK